MVQPLWKTVWQSVIKLNVHLPCDLFHSCLLLCVSIIRFLLLSTIPLGKQTVVYPSNAILLSNNRERIADTRDNLDESHRHYTEWKKPGSKIAYWMMPFIWHPWKYKSGLMTNRAVVAGWQGKGVSIKRYTREFLRWCNHPLFWMWWYESIYIYTNIYKTIQNTSQCKRM